MKLAILFSLAAILLSGCSLLTPKVGPAVAKAVTRYCAEPLAERQLLRQSVNDQISPNTVKVTCAGDQQ